MREILIGIVSGIVSGTGMGGGTILIFLLTFMIRVEQQYLPDKTLGTKYYIQPDNN